MTSSVDIIASPTDDDKGEDTFSREARGPLPHGVKLVAIEYPFRRGWKPWDNLDEDEEEAAVSFIKVLSRIGAASSVFGDYRSVFGTTKGYRIRLDILAGVEDIEKWLRPNGECDGDIDIKKRFDLRLAGGIFDVGPEDDGV